MSEPIADLDNDRAAVEKPEGDGDVHATALSRYERGYNHDRHNIEAAFDDLTFCNIDNQWSDEDRKLRNGRPMLAIDKTAQFVRQITGDMRQMRPSIKCVPVDDRGSQEVAAKILPGMIRYVEQRSDASAAYAVGADSQVRCGIGHWRVTTEYMATDTFLQELRIVPVDDGVSVIWDPDAILPTREDASWCFVPVDIAPESFKERWPGKTANSMMGAPQIYESWSTTDTVRIAEYFYKEPKTRRLARLSDGGVDDVTDKPDEEKDALAQGAKIEEREDFVIMRCMISAGDILEEPVEWPGRYIPVVPVIGEEMKKGKECIRRGVIRALKDVQRLYNYGISQQAEVIALQPKSPFVGTKKNFADHMDEWESANDENLPFLQYTPDQQNGGGPPGRIGPAASSAGIDDLLNRASQDYSAVTGIYPSALGAQSNESSGKAILARQREGDTGTYLYVDNFGRAIRYTGRILVDLIPRVYDTQRTIRIVGDDGKVDLVQINQAGLGQDGMTQVTLNDVTVGTYDVNLEMGPSFSTKREEARDGMQTLMQTGGPQFAVLFADLFAKMQDWPLADKVARRAHLMLPPQIQQAEAQESGEPPPPQMPPPPPTPEQQAKMAEAQLNAAKDQRQQNIDELKAQAALEAAKNETLKTELLLWQARMGGPGGAPGGAPGVPGAPAAAPAGGGDPRLDHVIQTVAELVNVVMGMHGHPPVGPGPHPAEQPPGGAPAPSPGMPPGGLPGGGGVPFQGAPPPGPPTGNEPVPPPGAMSQPIHPPPWQQ